MYQYIILLFMIGPVLSEATCGQRPGGARIVGGLTAAPNAWPWQLSLRSRGYHFCGASLISSDWALTAAHCVKRASDPSRYTLMAGGHHRKNGDGLGTIVGISKIIIHSKYGKPRLRNDLALLKLSARVQLTPKVNTVCLPTQGQRIAPGSICYIAGWGVESSWVNSSPDFLQQSQVPVVGFTQCEKSNGWFVNEDTMICAGGSGSSACSGDSGGPLMCEENGLWALRGAASWVASGYPKCSVRKPTVYARVSSYVEWITKITGVAPPSTQLPTTSVSQTTLAPDSTQPTTNPLSTAVPLTGSPRPTTQTPNNTPRKTPQTSRTPTQTPQTSPLPTQPGSCVDKSASCKTFVRHCQWNSHIQQICKKSCNLCLL